LHYAYPARFPYELLPIMNKYENVCKYLDIALQHINGRILKRMRRNITKKETYALIERIRCEVPGIHLRTTLMVGFPGETAEEFEELLQFVKDMRFERMGAFAYSEEEGTYSALNYKDDIPSEVKEQRLERIMQLQESISEEINSSKIGTVMQAVIDREEEDYYVARTEYDSPEVDPELLINKAKPLTAGKFYNIRITSAGPYDLFGEVE
ncbi:MAG: radical SAM protein, partial [Bacteroidales bacterium]